MAIEMNMSFGRLIRKFRIDRHLTQSQLASGICNRSTIAILEKDGTHISYELLRQLLDRLNIELNEFELICSKNDIFYDKERTRNKFVALLTSHSENDKINFFQDVELKFKQINDYFYYALCAEAHLIISYNTGTLGSQDDYVVKARTSIMEYLNRIENWDRFELVMFINCLFVFDDDYILVSLRTAGKLAFLYSNSKNYMQDFNALVADVLKLAIKRENIKLLNVSLELANKGLNGLMNTEMIVYKNIINFVTKMVQGQATINDQVVLFNHLSWLGMNGWINCLASANFNKFR